MSWPYSIDSVDAGRAVQSAAAERRRVMNAGELLGVRTAVTAKLPTMTAPDAKKKKCKEGRG